MSGPRKSPVQIKICGLTRLSDVEECVRLGVDAVGLNLWPGTKRVVSLPFVDEVRRTFPSLELVAVFVDGSDDEVRAALDLGVDALQFHGNEAPEQLARFGPHAYKAIGVGAGDDLTSVLHHAARFAGDRILVDARVPGAMPGGTGHAIDWALAKDLRAGLAPRMLMLAGGLVPANVGRAITQVRPAWVDTASGVESAPGIKDHERLAAFVNAVRAAEG